MITCSFSLVRISDLVKHHNSCRTAELHRLETILPKLNPAHRKLTANSCPLILVSMKNWQLLMHRINLPNFSFQRHKILSSLNSQSFLPTFTLHISLQQWHVWESVFTTSMNNSRQGWIQEQSIFLTKEPKQREILNFLCLHLPLTHSAILVS